METQNLKAFLAVAEAASFSNAAEVLHLTQPAVSKRIAALEHHLGTPLFDRIGRQVTLTEAGNALLPHALAVTSSLEQATQSIRDLGGTVSGRLRLATSHHIGLHRLPPILRRFSEAYPEVALDIDFMDSEQAHERIARGHLELGVVTLAPEVESSLLATPIWEDPLDFMAAAGHPLCRGGKLSLARLAEHPVIMPGDATYTGRIIRGLFERENLKLQVSLSTNYLETIRMMASVGLGWTLLPRTMLEPPLHSLAVPGQRPSRTLGLIYHRNRSLSNAARVFIAQLGG
jgi:DNA-binding transcriptional LysR family regulator